MKRENVRERELWIYWMDSIGEDGIESGKRGKENGGVFGSREY